MHPREVAMAYVSPALILEPGAAELSAPLTTRAERFEKPFVFFHAVSAAVGERRAIAMTITGEVLSAAEALRTGLVHKVVPIGELEQRALEVAQTVANYSSHAMHTGLGFVRTVQGQTWKDAAGVGRLIRDQFLKSTEFQADLRVFLNQKLTNQGKDVWRPEG